MRKDVQERMMNRLVSWSTGIGSTLSKDLHYFCDFCPIHFLPPYGYAGTTYEPWNVGKTKEKLAAEVCHSAE